MGNGLEVQTGKVPGTVVRRTPAPRPPFIGFLILCLAMLEFLFFYLVVSALVGRDLILDMWMRVNSWFGGPAYVDVPPANNAAAHDPAIPNGVINIGFQKIEFFLNEQTIVSFWIACIFFCLWYIIFLYQRFFTDHVTIAKRRFRKWEDEGAQLHD